MRLGDLDALKAKLNEIFDTVEVVLFDDIIATIDNAPTVDLWQLRQEATENALKKAGVLYKRPQGEWIRTGSLGNGNAHYECSECHYGDEHAESQEVPYCWHCGASMKKGGEEE